MPHSDKSRAREGGPSQKGIPNKVEPVVSSTLLPSKQFDWLLGILLVVAIFIAYMPVWHGGFIWDDSAHITRPGLRSLGGLFRIWTQLGATQQY